MARAESTAWLAKLRPPSHVEEHAAPMPPAAPPAAPPALPVSVPESVPVPLRATPAATPSASPACAAALAPAPAVVRNGDEALRARTVERDALLSATLPSPTRSTRRSEPVPRTTASGESPPPRRGAASTASATSPPSVFVQRRLHGKHAAHGAMTVTGSPFTGWDGDDPPLWEPTSLPRTVTSTRPRPLSPPVALSPLSPMRLPPRSPLLGHPGHPVFTPADSPPENRAPRRHAAAPSAAAPASDGSEAVPTVLVEPSTAGVVADQQLGTLADPPTGCDSAVEALRAAVGSQEEASAEDAEQGAAR